MVNTQGSFCILIYRREIWGSERLCKLSDAAQLLNDGTGIFIMTHCLSTVPVFHNQGQFYSKGTFGNVRYFSSSKLGRILPFSESKLNMLWKILQCAGWHPQQKTEKLKMSIDLMQRNPTLQNPYSKLSRNCPNTFSWGRYLWLVNKKFY
jgi:hypothetical protein